MFVVPGRANPESMNGEQETGFRARPFGPSRNDAENTARDAKRV
jgi:hypothetical protein